MLSRNVTKEHIHEIFSCFGDIKNVTMPTQGNSIITKLSANGTYFGTSKVVFAENHRMDTKYI